MKDIIVKSEQKTLDSGVHEATLIAIADLGPVESSYNGVSQGLVHKIMLGFELSPSSDYPYIIWKQYTLTFGRGSSLKSDLESWRGAPYTNDEISKGISISKAIGKLCQLNIGMTSGGNTKIISVLPASKNGGFTTKNKPFMFSYKDPKLENMDKLPRYVKDMLDVSVDDTDATGVTEQSDDIISTINEMDF